MFIDELELHLRAGNGGDGIVSWRHEKGRDMAGPGGGDGGNGGDFYVRGVRDISRLSEYKFEKDFNAEDGVNGMKNGMHGKNGEDFIFDVPIGSVLKNKETGEIFDIVTEEKTLILKGGRGGRGNEHFKSSKNVSPTEFTLGKKAEAADFFIELKLVVDLGLVGLPNAGKSSLLNAITNAKAKIGNYQFTTLEPNLGDLYGNIIADIPGLIEGASEGRGLGMTFLRHISRTHMIIHCVSAENLAENIDPVSVYKTIRGELTAYGQGLDTKPEIILITKTDMTDEKNLKKVVSALKKAKSKVTKDILIVSIIDDESLKKLKEDLSMAMKSI